MIYFLSILLIGFLFGISNKIADLLNEHGLKLFKNADILFGLVWGILGSILVFYNEHIAINYFALMIYWFFMIKLEYKNHSLAGTMIIFSSLYIINFDLQNKISIILLFLANYLTIIAQHSISKKWPFIARLRLRIYIIPFVYGLLVNDLLVFWVTLSAMLGVEIATNYYEYKKKNSQVAKEYNKYKQFNILDEIGIDVFNNNYVGQESSLNPDYLINLLKNLEVNSSYNILDIGCGKGGLDIALAKNIGCNITGIDISEKSIELAKKNTKEQNLEKKCFFSFGSIADLPIKSSFDIILSIGSLYWFESSSANAINIWKKFLKQNGIIVIFINRIFKTPDIKDLELLPKGMFLPHKKWTNSLAQNGFNVKENNITLMLKDWIYNWNKSLFKHEKSLNHQMGKHDAEKFINKFKLLEKYLNEDKLSRTVIIAKKN